MLALLDGEQQLPFDMGDPQDMPVPLEFDRAAWAAQNDRFRQKAMEFFREVTPRPVAKAVVLRMCMAPVQQMEKQEFWVAECPLARVVSNCIWTAGSWFIRTATRVVQMCAHSWVARFFSVMAPPSFSVCRNVTDSSTAAPSEAL